jgi:hypothetical protein
MISWFRYVDHYDVGHAICAGWFVVADLGPVHGVYGVLMKWGGGGEPPGAGPTAASPSSKARSVWVNMATVTVRPFSSVNEALRALAEAEYREFLRDCGCPADTIDAEVEKYIASYDLG